MAAEAGGEMERGPPLRRIRMRLVATAISLALAVRVVAAAFGIRDDLATHVFSPMYLYKAVTMACIAVAGLSLVRAAVTPGASMRLAQA